MSERNEKSISFPIKLFGYIRGLEQEHYLIPKKRKQELLELSSFIAQKIKKKEDAEIIVICTHNSRRSQFGQIWLKTAATYYGVKKLKVFSGGTEITAFHPNAVAALRHVGFRIEKSAEDDNPMYECEIGQEGKILMMFSKKYSDPNHPEEEFAALMVCSDADAACPVVAGAEARFAIPYDDPKNADGTEEMAGTYLDSCQQIGREMFFVVKNAL